MKYLVLTMRGPGFLDEVRIEHYAFLDRLRAEGRLEISGPFTDKSGGAYILRAASLDEAQSLAFQDPLHRRNCSMVTVREWNAG